MISGCRCLRLYSPGQKTTLHAPDILYALRLRRIICSAHPPAQVAWRRAWSGASDQRGTRLLRRVNKSNDSLPLSIWPLGWTVRLWVRQWRSRAIQERPMLSWWA